MARCDTCYLAQWEPGCITRVWCKKKKEYIRLDGARHLFAAAENIRRGATPISRSSVTVSEAIKT